MLCKRFHFFTVSLEVSVFSYLLVLQSLSPERSHPLSFSREDLSAKFRPHHNKYLILILHFLYHLFRVAHCCFGTRFKESLQTTFCILFIFQLILVNICHVIQELMISISYLSYLSCIVLICSLGISAIL